MKKKIYISENGVKRDLTPSEVKARTIKNLGITPKEYEKLYDRTRNRVRNYEKYQRLQGVEVEPRNIAHFLYFESRAMKRYGADYKPSTVTSNILSFSSASTGQGISKKVEENINKRYREYILQRFGSLINSNEGAAAIYSALYNEPAKLEQALTKYADDLHIKMKESLEAEKNAAIPIGIKVGSGATLSIENYV